jgi:NADH-quinone oxidoreductase subunit M
MNWLLTILTFLPLLGVLAILLVKPPQRGTDDTIKIIAIGTSAITFLASLLVLFRFDASNPALQLVDRVDWIPSWGIRISWVWTASASSWCC